MTARLRLRLVLAALALVAIALVVWVMFHRRPAPAAAPHAIPVTAARVAAQDTPLTLTSLGSALAWTSVTVLSQASGKLIRVNFVEGSEVRAGQLLAEVDPEPYRAALVQAQGALQRDRASLAGQRRDLARFRRLLADNAIAGQTVDDQAALVAQTEGTVLLDEGQVAAARINLAYTRITSPIAGRAGVRLVDVGNLVSASGSVASTPNTSSATSNAAPSGTAVGAAATTAGGGASSVTTNSSGSGIVVINQIQPMAVTFTVPQGQFHRLVNLSNGFTRPLVVRAYDQDTGVLLDSGQVTIADNRVDAATGTVQLKAEFPNVGRRLWPGEFVNVKLTLQTLRNATLVPSTAVNRGPNGLFAFVVGPDNHVVLRPVALVANEDTLAILKSGVRPGELVVTDGQMSLKNGSLVRVIQVAPVAGAAP
jgi:multidrug efflux system membrane fusion protein